MSSTGPVAFEPRATRKEKASAKRPSKRPSKLPSKRPSKLPSKRPSKRPCKKSSKKPSKKPPANPTKRLTAHIIVRPTVRTSKVSTISTRPDTYRVPSPTKAVNICDGLIECESDYDFLDDQHIGLSFDEASTSGPARTYEPEYAAGQAVIEITSLPYVETPKFFPIAKQNNLTFDFSGKKDIAYKVNAAHPADAEGYVVEHIIDLQTVKLFIEKLIGAGEPKNKYIIKSPIGAQWFGTCWNEDLDGKKVAGRMNPNSLPDRNTVNSLVYQALGSKANYEDLVMLEEQINEMKKRPWMGYNMSSRGKDVKDLQGGVVKVGDEWKEFMQEQLDFTAAGGKGAAHKIPRDSLRKSIEDTITKAKAHKQEWKKDSKEWEDKATKEQNRLTATKTKLRTEAAQLSTKNTDLEKKERTVQKDIDNEPDPTKQLSLKKNKLAAVKKDLSIFRG
ncbi:uncharacterized protein N0V89_010829 [Didymosphaeria variabile]|uniref:Uncharacterized protein n=1 Tax=Didymosphaeria variabile TaxID=1932322 RepID=A0A9W9C6I7_9PLEO|nr:uncharacterized protein N0V89_010829 [Didymosphaeria variabile]KAJ4346896.1 hypothetical protein N0V89_010829 [Didymosphaeria variabile]